MNFVVEQETFSGPLSLLLELLDKNKLEIKDVSLRAIAGDYLRFIKEQEVPSEQMADFLLVASKLIYLKSKELMPYLVLEEEERGVRDLEEQLRLYRLFLRAADKLADKFSDAERSFARIPTKRMQKIEFSPPANVDKESLRSSFVNLLKKLEPFFALREVSMERVKSVEERLQELKGALIQRKKISFRDLSRRQGKKIDVVVSFLALLELVRQQLVYAKQEENDIIIEKI
ncbi:hypothetical protein D6827_03895 [Candidatus Parcubacteria bacterium]|nr:MAG: hypothetical protein D6827_03895 [Candidatus Parcubacteria bacterium]